MCFFVRLLNSAFRKYLLFLSPNSYPSDINIRYSLVLCAPQFSFNLLINTIELFVSRQAEVAIKFSLKHVKFFYAILSLLSEIEKIFV